MQKKILKFIHFRKRHEQYSDIFETNGILTVYELYIYELLKFVLRSINGLHGEKYSNSYFVFDQSGRCTRSSGLRLLKVPQCKKKIEKNSILYRSTILFNALERAKVLPLDVTNITPFQLSTFVHTFRNNLLIGNHELINLVFK